MKRKHKEASTVEALQRELETWRTKQAELVAKIEAVGVERARLRAERGELLLGAYAGDDEEASRKLEPLTAALLRADIEAADLAEMVGRLERKLGEIETKLAAEKQADAKAKLHVLAAERFEVSTRMETLADELRGCLDKWCKISFVMDEHAERAGITARFMRSHHIRDAMIHAVFSSVQPRLLPAPFLFFRRPLTTLEREYLSGWLPGTPQGEAPTDEPAEAEAISA